MKLKVLLIVVCILVFALVQSTVLDYAEVYSVKPNLLMVFIVCFALLRGNLEGAAAGFFAGLMQDIISGKIMGFYSLLGLYLGLVVGSLNKRLYRENVFVVIFFTFVSSVVYEFLVFFFAVFLSGYRDILFVFRNNILPEAVYNSVVSIIVFLVVLKLNNRLEDVNKASRKY